MASGAPSGGRVLLVVSSFVPPLLFPNLVLWFWIGVVWSGYYTRTDSRQVSRRATGDDELGAVTFRCPACRNQVGLDALRSVSACPSCGVRLATDDGIVDFVAAAPVVKSRDERAYYDKVYADVRPRRSGEARLATLGPRWHGPEAPPERQAAWRRLGDLIGKTVLLLGNGDSFPSSTSSPHAPRS